MKFYTTARARELDFIKRGVRSRFTGKTGPEACSWQGRTRPLFEKLLGLDRFAPWVPRGKKIGSTFLNGLHREEWLIQTEAQVWMPVTILRPPGKGPFPAVLALHGHGMGGRLGPSGSREHPLMPSVFEKYNCDYGLQLAGQGMVAVCPDARGFGARREGSKQDETSDPGRFNQSSCAALQLASVPMGFTLQGMWTRDLMALIDWMGRDRSMDLGNLSCVGLSGGGLQTLILMALDARVKHAVVSGYFYGVRESLQELHENCMCNMVPHLWEHLDMGDIAALAAPRSLFIETGSKDHLNGKSGLANVASQVRVARKVYRAMDAPGNIRHDVFPGGHRFHGVRSIPWLLGKIRG